MLEARRFVPASLVDIKHCLEALSQRRARGVLGQLRNALAERGQLAACHTRLEVRRDELSVGRLERALPIIGQQFSDSLTVHGLLLQFFAQLLRHC